MKLAFAVVALFACVGSRAQSKPEVKGHAIGEDISAFIAKEPSVERQLADCRNPPRPISVDEVKKMKIPSFEKGDYERRAKQGQLFDRDPNGFHQTCDGLLSAVDSGARADISTSYADYAGDPKLAFLQNSAAWTFDHGKLIRLNMLVRDTYEGATLDLTQKFGPRSSEDSAPYHNGFGATWQNRTGIWETPELHITLYDDENPAASNREPLLTIETRSEHEREIRSIDSRPNPLD